jgi:diaminohydroxyphosphoribosylaminopyrimidine deaminase/5-amino-6-(5-phosphoribosylamino)uracil reductase
MVGVNTVLRDDPQLSARGPGDTLLPHQPVGIVVDSQGRTPTTARLLGTPGLSLITCTEAIPGEKEAALRARGAQVLKLPSRHGKVDLHALLQELGKRQLASVLVEGGGTLLGELFHLRLVDYVVAFVAPVILGGRQAPTPVEGQGVARLSEALRLQKVQVEQLGPDVLITGRLESS